MAVTQNTYTGNASTTNFAFTFPYLKKADVKVKLDGTTQPTTEYTWFNATTIQMNTAPASGVVVLIYRDTSNDSKAGTFYAGSMIKAEDLNSNFDQILYVAQEVSNNAMSTLGTAEMQGNLAFGKSMGIVFEGDTNDAYETTLKVVDPTADRALNLPNVSGTLVSTGDTGTVTSTMLADGTIATADIANNAITTAKIGGEAVTANEIANATITGTELAADCINGTKIADDSINSEHYVADSIDSEHYAPNSVDADALAHTAVTAGSYTAADITVDAQGRITSAASGTIATSEIAADAITGAKIADDQINSEHYVDGSIDTAHIADSQVTTAKIADVNVTTAKIANDAVTNAKIADDQIDSEHYVDGSIDTAHIADDQVTVGKLNIPRVETLAGMTSTTASTLAAAADLSASITNLNITQGMTKATSLTTTSDTEYPTSKAVNDRILTVTNALGGFVAIADKDNFPTAHPDPSGNAGTVVSISDAVGISVNSSGVGSLATRAGGSDAVIINGFPSALRGGATVGSATNANPYVLPSSVGLQVQTTTTAHTYDYHKYFINEEDANKLSGDIQDFQERYRVAASAPTASKDDGDLWFDTTNNKMMVYDTTASAWSDVATPGNFTINTISSYSGTGGNSATFNGTAYRFVLSKPPTQSAAQLVVSINGVIQKPNAGTSQPSEGFVIDGSSIIFSNAPASGSDYFIITLGNSVDIGTPSDNVITTAMLQNSAVTTAKITNDAVDGTKIADDAINSEHYTDGSIDTAHIAADAVTGAKIADDAVGSEHIEVLDSHLQLADNAIIKIGTGDDLNLFHDGTDSTIDNNTGALYIKSNTSAQVLVNNTENAIIATANGAVELYHDNAKKFETTSGGIEITGTTATQKLTATNTYSATGTTQVGYQVHNESDTTDTYAALRLTAGTTSPATAQISSVRKGAGSNDITFQLEDSNTAKEVMRLTSAGKVGIGVTAPDARLALPAGESSTPIFAIESAVDANDFTFSQYEDGSGVYTLIGQNVKLDSSGNNAILDSSHKTAGITFDGRNNGALMFNTGDTNAFTEAMRIDKSGRILIGSGAATTTNSNRLIQVVGDTNGGGIITLARDDTALSNETIGGFEFFGNDPGSAFTRTAGIYVEAAANWSSSDYPSQMIFQTTVDGTSSPTRKLELGHNYVQTNSTVYFNSADNSEPLAAFVEGGTCKLYYDGGSYAKLETITDGVQIGGTGYAGYHRLDSNAYHIGQNSDNRDLRFYSGADEHTNLDTGVRLEVAHTTWSSFSDERLKENITDIGSVLTKIKDIRCITYTRKNKTKAPETLGFIAQDFVGKFDQVLGEGVVSESDSTKYYSIRYTETIPILLKAIQELSAKVAALEAA